MGQALTLDLEIFLEGEKEPVLVTADQRDMAAFERDHGVGTQEAFQKMTMIFLRSLAWYALVRTGELTKATVRDKWLEKVISVEAGDEEDEDPNPPIDAGA